MSIRPLLAMLSLPCALVLSACIFDPQPDPPASFEDGSGGNGAPGGGAPAEGGAAAGGEAADGGNGGVDGGAGGTGGAE